jgi:hypothetical protein
MKTKENGIVLSVGGGELQEQEDEGKGVKTG